MKQSRDSHETVMRHSWDSHETVVRHLWDSYVTVKRKSWDSHDKVISRAAVGHFSNGDFKKKILVMVFLWPFWCNGNQMGTKLGLQRWKMGTFSLKTEIYVYFFFLHFLLKAFFFLSPENNHIYWSPPNVSTSKIPCNPDWNFSKCERL